MWMLRRIDVKNKKEIGDGSWMRFIVVYLCLISQTTDVRQIGFGLEVPEMRSGHFYFTSWLSVCLNTYSGKHILTTLLHSRYSSFILHAWHTSLNDHVATSHHPQVPPAIIVQHNNMKGKKGPGLPILFPLIPPIHRFTAHFCPPSRTLPRLKGSEVTWQEVKKEPTSFKFHIKKKKKKRNQSSPSPFLPCSRPFVLLANYNYNFNYNYSLVFHNFNSFRPFDTFPLSSFFSQLTMEDQDPVCLGCHRSIEEGSVVAFGEGLWHVQWQVLLHLCLSLKSAFSFAPPRETIDFFLVYG